MSTVEVRNRFSRPSVGLDCSDSVDMTKQSFKDECDINFIMGKYAKGQVVDHLAKYQGNYGFVEAATLHDMMNIVTVAQTMFNDLESEVRLRFGNSPEAFLAFAQDEKNLPELRKMGLAKPLDVEQAKPEIAAPGAAGAGTVPT